MTEQEIRAEYDKAYAEVTAKPHTRDEVALLRAKLERELLAILNPAVVDHTRREHKDNICRAYNDFAVKESIEREEFDGELDATWEDFLTKLFEAELINELPSLADLRQSGHWFKGFMQAAEGICRAYTASDNGPEFIRAGDELFRRVYEGLNRDYGLPIEFIEEVK